MEENASDVRGLGEKSSKSVMNVNVIISKDVASEKETALRIVQSELAIQSKLSYLFSVKIFPFGVCVADRMSLHYIK